VTGPGCYRYYQMSDDMSEFECEVPALISPGLKLSDDYSCHTWDDAARIMVCTTAGEMILTDYTGKFLAYINESPGQTIKCCLFSQNGLVLGGDKGHIWTY
jgi:hypothetical protein